jgi:hypothetical protein
MIKEVSVRVWYTVGEVDFVIVEGEAVCEGESVVAFTAVFFSLFA